MHTLLRTVHQFYQNLNFRNPSFVTHKHSGSLFRTDWTSENIIRDKKNSCDKKRPKDWTIIVHDHNLGRLTRLQRDAPDIIPTLFVIIWNRGHEPARDTARDFVRIS